MKSRVPSSPGLSLALASLAIVLGSGSIVMNAFNWYYLQQSLSQAGEETILALVSQFYVAEGLAIACLGIGIYLVYRIMLSAGARSEPTSVRFTISNVLTSRRDLRVGFLAAVAYGLLYAFVSGTLVYQPGVATWPYASGLAAAACCGVPGTVPSLIVYLLPGVHLALELIPVNMLFSLLLPVLVGFNAAVTCYALRSGTRSSAKWFGSVGLLAGLFTGCPTCAGLFLAGAVGGVGATALAVALSAYQLLFVVVSIPLLLVSPVIMASAVTRASCPTQPGKR